MDQIADVFDEISQDPTAESSGSKLTELYNSVYQLMSQKDSKQVPEELPGGADFNLFPTIGDFKKENDKWKNIEEMIDKVPPPRSVQTEVTRYCLVKKFYSRFLATSYYGATALDVLHDSRGLI